MENIVIRALAEEAHVGTAGTPTIPIMNFIRKSGPAKTGPAEPTPTPMFNRKCMHVTAYETDATKRLLNLSLAPRE